MSGIGRIAKERQRHFDVEGWTPEHDNQYDQGELAMAAACYSAFAQMLCKVECEGLREQLVDEAEPAEWWPWDESWWKPSPDPIRNLEKAGALIAAQIDRLERAQEQARNSINQSRLSKECN